MKKIYFSIIIAIVCFFVSTTSIAQVTVTGSTGANATYATLTDAAGAFAAINAAGSQAGNNILITITASITTETGLHALNANNWTTLTINPSGGGPRTISGTINGPLIDLNGADNVTIDGVQAGGNNLFIQNNNTGTSASTIRFVNDATNNTVIRCVVNGSTGAAGSFGLGTIFFSTGTTTGNIGNTISNVSIGQANSSLPINGIYSLGTSIAVPNTVIINNCNVINYFNTNSASNGLNINTGSTGWTITNNKLYQTGTRTYSTGSTHNGIFITSGAGYTINNNVIGFASSAATGTTEMIGLNSGVITGTFPGAYTVTGVVSNATRFNAINCAFTAGGAVSSLQNNTVGGIALFTSSGATTTFGLICGIAVTSGNANIGTVTGNTIGSVSGASSIYAATTTAGGIISGIYCTSSNIINIENNTIGGIDISGTTNTRATGFKGIEVAGTGVYTVSDNKVGNAAANNIRAGYLLTGANLSNVATTPTAASGASVNQAILSSSAGATLNITNNIVQGILMSGSAANFTGINNTAAVTTTININNNQLGTSGVGAITFSTANTGTIIGITNSGGVATTTVNLNNNTVQGISAVSSGQLVGITNSGNAGVAVNINNNNLGSATANFINYSAATGSTILGFYNGGGVAATTVLSISNNDIRGIVYAVTASTTHQYINSFFAGATQNINNNTFTNLTVNTTGNIFFIFNQGNMTATGVENCSNNRIVTAFNKTAAGGTIFFYNSIASSVNGSAMIQTGNNFSNVTVTGTTTIDGWANGNGASTVSAPTKTITGNTFSNITGGTGLINVMEIDFSGSNSTVSSNIISNINSNGQILGILYGPSNNQGTHTISSNTISSLSSTATGSIVIGISAGAATVPILSVNTNTITGLSTTGASLSVMGVLITDGATVNVNANIINNISGSGSTSPVARGILVSAGSTVNVGYNKIHTISQSALITTATGPVVVGISFTGGVNVTAHNNFVANLNADNTAFADAIRGISVTSSIPLSTYNLYYNSIHVNSASALALFGTSGVYHTANATATTAALNMINNIIVNTSASAGTGFTAAYRRSNTTLTNFTATSNYNLLYAGTPSATNVIFNDGTNRDQTLAAYQTRVTAREANSISSFPNFTSATDLHLTPNNCTIDNRGIAIAGFTNDVGADTRSSTIPDIGADEFDAYNAGVLAGVVGTAVCANKAVVNTGTLYTDVSCNQIARVLPSGGAPVAGVINTCVTLDASPLFFNGEPYVQRHYDIEPGTAPATATGTITLYFTDAEFVNYNTTFPVWPDMPTVLGGGSGDPNIANVRITQFHGVPTGGLPTSTPGNYTGTRELIVPTSVTENSGVWAVTFPVTGFSGFYAHTTVTNAPLPVTVNYLTGHKQGSNHLLKWKVTCASTPRATMTLERSSDAQNYTGINTITADAARCDQPFDYTDAKPLAGMNYYRLKIADADGKITYSTTVALLNAAKGFDIISIAPNPVVADNFKLNVASAQAGKMEIVIFDMQGRLVNRQSLTLIAGYNSMLVNASNLSSGTYTIKGSMADDQFKVIRFVKQ